MEKKENNVLDLKKQISTYAKKCLQEKWINEDDYKYIIDLLDKEELTIGIVGQMNVGKSSVLNALFFGEEIDTLPTSEVPMTATLTYIKYGEEESAVITMITEDDFQDIVETQALANPDEDHSKEEIEAAKYLHDRITSIPNFESYLGIKKKLTKEEYVDFIGADGKMTSLAKTVTLTKNNAFLKGVNIVDTPGFNDPVISRNATTSNFLKKANVIVFVQSALATFESADIALMQDQVPQSGVGKLVIAINKKDLLSSSDLEKVMAYAESKRAEIAHNKDKYGKLSDLLNDSNIVPISSMMALIGQAPKEILEKEPYAFYKEQFEFDMPDLQVQDYVEHSGIRELWNLIMEIIKKEKFDAAVRIPASKLLALVEIQINKHLHGIETLRSHNMTLASESCDIKKILKDLGKFEDAVAEICVEEGNICIRETNNMVRDVITDLVNRKDAKVRNIKFEDNKRSKKYLRELYNKMDDLYREFNTEIYNTVVVLSYDIKGCLVKHCNKIEDRLNGVILENAQNVHTSLMSELRGEIERIPSFSPDKRNYMNKSCPDYAGRQDIYEEGIRLYFRRMFSEDYDDAYFDELISPQVNKKDEIMRGGIVNFMLQVVTKTKKYFEKCGSAVEKETTIKENEKEIVKLEQEILALREMVEQIIKISK